jgi:CheY-like chemotaxis protein
MYRILLIEDDKQILDSLVSAGREAGVDTTTVDPRLLAKGRADEVCTQVLFDAIVVGGYFPDARLQYGHQIVERIRQRNTRVIIVGTAGDPRRETDFLKAGANAFVERGIHFQPAAGLTAALGLLTQKTQPNQS